MIRAAVLSILLASSPHGDDPARLQKNLYEAAAAGNHAKFTSALERAKALVETLRLGPARDRLRRAVIVATDLDRVWNHEGLYWDEESLPDYYDRMAGEYPGFERYIAQYRVIDGSRRVFYPARETRAFLTERLRPANYRKKHT